MRGRIAPLISLGVGFHQEMSGRENVLVNGLLLGLSAKQLAQRFDQIVEFAELEEFIDTPVKFYSSGMFMRLGFSVVAHVDPQVLLVDEILAVGDAGFQLKCFERLRTLQQQGAAIVMVSHSMHMIRQLCPRAVLIRHGKIEYDGNIEKAIALHYQSVSDQKQRSQDGAVRLLDCRLLGGEGENHHANYDEQLELRLHVRFARVVTDPLLTLHVSTGVGFPVMSQTQPLKPRDGAVFRPGQEITVRVPFRARLGGGTYELAVEIRASNGEKLAQRDRLMLFVAGRPAALGVVDLHAEVEVEGVDLTDRRSMLLGQ